MLSAVVILCMEAIACRHSTSERWIIPAGYVGWLRLDYSVNGAPPLPLEHGRYVIRVPLSGRVATSTVNDPSVDNNEYYVQDSGGLRKLYFGWPPAPGYAVQNAYGQGHFRPSDNFPKQTRVKIEFECLFVGTRSDFSANSSNCSAWRNGDPEPPKFTKRPVLPHPSGSRGSTSR